MTANLGIPRSWMDTRPKTWHKAAPGALDDWRSQRDPWGALGRPQLKQQHKPPPSEPEEPRNQQPRKWQLSELS